MKGAHLLVAARAQGPALCRHTWAQVWRGQAQGPPLLLEAPGGLSQVPGLALGTCLALPCGVGGRGLWLEGAFSAALQHSAGEGGPEPAQMWGSPSHPMLPPLCL